MKVTIKEIKGRSNLKQFVRFPNEMYKGNPYYVPQLESADLDILDPSRNHAFEVCESAYWMAFDENGKAVGRIAGIINHRYIEKIGTRQARFGFLDFIDDESVVDALFDTFEAWARSKGMTEADGPLGFLEFDASGVLVNGFEELPTAYGKYNFPYYEKHLIRRGYAKDVDWIESRVRIPDDVATTYSRAAQIVANRYNLHVIKPKSRSEIKNRYAEEILNLMNQAYNVLHGYSMLTPGQLEDLKNQFLPLVNPGLLGLVADENERIVAFSIFMPSMAQAMQKAGGHLFPFGWIHVARALKHNDTMDTLLVGVADEYKNKGVNAMLFDSVGPTIAKMGFKWLETTRELEDNFSVRNLMNRFEFKETKRARCYLRKL